MSENQMKDRIVEELKKAKEAGQITTQKVREIVSKAVSAAVAETRGGVEELRPVVKNAVTAAVEGLKEAEVDVKETVEGAVEGAIAGVRSRGDQAVEATRDELRKLEKRLKDEKTELAQGLRKGLEGAKEAGAALPEDLKGRVESAVSDIKLKSTELSEMPRKEP
jgi:NADH dehydrogenase/NADH:ubiquinone oxidoreductase subunit G